MKDNEISESAYNELRPEEKQRYKEVLQYRPDEVLTYIDCDYWFYREAETSGSFKTQVLYRLIPEAPEPVKRNPYPYGSNDWHDWKEGRKAVSEAPVKEETVEEIAKRLLPDDYFQFEDGQKINTAILKRKYFQMGYQVANVQSSNPKYIERDKVIEIVHYGMTVVGGDYLQKLDYIISKIKAI